MNHLGVVDLLQLDHNSTEYDVTETLVAFFLSVLPVVIYIIYHHCYYQWLQTHDCEFEGRKRKILFELAMLIVCFFLTYFNQILINIMTLIATQNIGDETFPMYKVINSFEVDAWSAYHIWLLFLAAFPLILALLMFFTTWMISRELIKKETSVNNLFREAKIHFGLLVLGFKRTWWWWTYIIWLRKIVISMLIAMVLLQTNYKEVNQSLFLIILILTVNAYYQRKYNPLINDELNNFESTNLLI